MVKTINDNAHDYQQAARQSNGGVVTQCTCRGIGQQDCHRRRPWLDPYRSPHTLRISSNKGFCLHYICSPEIRWNDRQAVTLVPMPEYFVLELDRWRVQEVWKPCNRELLVY